MVFWFGAVCLHLFSPERLRKVSDFFLHTRILPPTGSGHERVGREAFSSAEFCRAKAEENGVRCRKPAYSSFTGSAACAVNCSNRASPRNSSQIGFSFNSP
jgi:hypothetical protein